MTSIRMYSVFLCLFLINSSVLGFRRTYHKNHKERSVVMERQMNSNGYDSTSFYTKDPFNVYFMGQKIDGANVFSFKSLNYGYAKDSFNVYYMGEKVDGANVFSFQVLMYAYAKDAFNVYSQGRKIDGANALSFRVLANGYAKDSVTFYLFGKKLSGVPPYSFSRNTIG